MRVLFAATAMLGAVVAPQPASAALLYDYEFNGSLANFGKATGTLVNNGGTVGATSLSFGVNQGPSITGITPLSVYTIDTVFTFEAVNGYRRIADFLNKSSDSGLYILNGGLNFFTQADGPDNVVTAGSPIRVTFSRDADTVAIGYINGVAQFSFGDTMGLATIGSILHFFQDDNQVGGEASAGSVDYLRIYDIAYTLGTLPPPPVASVPEPTSWAMLIGGIGLAGSALRRRRSMTVRYA